MITNTLKTLDALELININGGFNDNDKGCDCQSDEKGKPGLPCPPRFIG